MRLHPTSDGLQPILATASNLETKKNRYIQVCYMVFFGVNVNMASLETVTPVVAQRQLLKESVWDSIAGHV